MCLQSHHEPIQYQCPFRGSFKKVKYSHLRPVKSEKHPQTINNHTQFGHQVSDTASASCESFDYYFGRKHNHEHLQSQFSQLNLALET